jgi:hypothetical protein
MKRAGSRYGLPPTNKSLKYAMVEFQDVRGSYAYLHLPGDTTALSLNKKKRWAFTEGLIPSDVPVYVSYSARGVSNCLSPRLASAIDSGKPIVRVDIIGRAATWRGAPSIVKSSGAVVYDERHAAYSAAECCGCTLCSQRPRKKALKKGKGKRKHNTHEVGDM